MGWDGRRRDPERVVRAPSHLGDVVLALPALAAEKGDVRVVRGLAPILAMAIGEDRGAGSLLADGHEECTRLITVEQVERNTERALAEVAGGPAGEAS